MALGFNGDQANYLTKAISFGADRGTVMAWCRLAVDRNSYSTFFFLNETDNAQWVVQTAGDGTTLSCYIYDNSVTGRSLAVGTRYHIAATWDGSTARVYVDGVLDISNTATGSDWTQVTLGRSAVFWDEPLNGDMSDVLAWDLTFTAAQIRRQMLQKRPITFNKLKLWLPTLPGANERNRDYSGNNNHLTVNGTITDAPNPPLPWRRQLWMVPFVVASDQSVTVTDAGSGTDNVVVGTGLETDTFTAADGTALATHDSDWVVNFGGFAINNNSAHADAAGSISMAHREGNIWPADQYAEATVAAIGAAGSIGVAVRCASGTTATGYVFYSDQFLSYLFKYVNGSFTQVGTTGSPFQAGDVVRLEAIGTTLRPLVNGQLWTQGELTDASIASGYPGIGGYGNSTGSRIDDWVGSGLDATMQLRSISDAGMGADALAGLAVSLALADTGAGNDAFGAAADVATADTGSGSDSIAQLLASLLLAENGAGADALVDLAVALTAADSGAGSDAIASLAASVTAADAGSGTDALASLAAALGVADSGSGADTLAGLGAALGVSDAASGVDALANLAAALGVTDSGAGADTLAGLGAALDIADAGSGADALAGLTAGLIVMETGAGTDALAGLGASLGIADAGAGADALGNVAANVTVADSGVGADSPSISVTLSVADSGAGVDDVLQLILIAIADSGAAVDSLASIAVAFTLGDSGAGGEALAIQVTVSVADAGSGDEAINLLTEALKQVLDSGVGTDLVPSPAVSLTVLDSGAGYDAAAVSVTVAVADSGSAAEALSIIATMLVTILDNGTGSDALAVSVAPIVVADSGVGDDAPGIAVALTLADAGAGSDALLTSVLLTVADAAAGTDAFGSITVNVAVADIGQAVDVLGQVSAVLSVLDLGTGVDVALRFDSAVKLVKVVFTLARRTVAFAWLARSIEFGWSRRTVEFALNS